MGHSLFFSVYLGMTDLMIAVWVWVLMIVLVHLPAPLVVVECEETWFDPEVVPPDIGPRRGPRSVP